MPEAEEVVGELRHRLDPAARLGVPAHITILYPFLDPAAVHDRAVRRLRTLFSSVPRFSYWLNRIGWFGDEVVWLGPDPVERFAALTQLVSNAWPDLEPYGGAHESVTPHLTLGNGGSLPEMRSAAVEVEASLPIAALAHEVWLIDGCGAPASWRLQKRFTLRE